MNVQRDWDLVRQLLLKLEELGTTASVLMPEDLAPYDADKVSYHMKILNQAGLIEASCAESSAGTHCFASGLTWAGHEFLDTVLRDRTRWNRLKAFAREKSVALSFEALKAAASVLVAKALTK